ncbi:MAG: Rieske (2Fe-2S) protein [Rhizomicrobium sp.]|jgi:nitrite reductase/ring-hydroxylating ferredoxin subunit
MFTSSGVTRSELARDGQRLVRRGGKQVLLLAYDGKLFAIANRCPHEGYPLSEGTLGPGCVLTCNWHNWKFDLRSGAALVGRDPVRTYEISERDGEILIDLSDPPADAQRAHALKGLDQSIIDVDLSRMARETARLELAGFDGRTAIVHAFAARSDFLEEGMTHAHAAAADWLALADRAKTPEERLTALLEPIHHIAWDTLGSAEFSYATDAAEWNPEDYVAAIEAEDERTALALMRGALAAQIPYGQLRPAIAEAALSHYADFGHCAIYTLKTGQLIERLGEDAAEPALLALTRMLVRATREERLPEFRGYARAVAEWNDGGREPARAADFVGLSVDGVLKRTIASSNRPIRELFDALVGAAAWNFRHFDTEFQRATDNPIADNISWLDFTHALTFANAIRHLCNDKPELWPHAALQLALFIGRNRKYVRAEEEVSRWRVNDRANFIAWEMHGLYDHAIPEPIIACHRLKVLFALEDELAASPDVPWADDMLGAVNRYLHTPMKRHNGLRTASQALDFVAKEG